MKYDDETLMAYADGALDKEQAAQVRRASAADPAIARRIEQFRDSAAQVKQAFDAELDAPVPAALLASVREAVAKAQQSVQPAAAATSAAPVEVAKPIKRSFFGWAANEPRYALAASFSALVVGIAGYLAGVTQSGTGQYTTASAGGGVFAKVSVVDATSLSAALTEVASGQSRVLGTEAEQVKLVATFRDRAGVLCREFVVVRTGADANQAVACRTQDQWAVKAIAVVTSAGGAYTPASGHAAVDSYLNLIEAGPPLSAQEEQQALKELRK